VTVTMHWLTTVEFKFLILPILSGKSRSESHGTRYTVKQPTKSRGRLLISDLLYCHSIVYYTIPSVLFCNRICRPGPISNFVQNWPINAGTATRAIGLHL
jgi:hypothetical protein